MLRQFPVRRGLMALALSFCVASTAVAQTPAPSMLHGEGWDATPVFTVSETVGTYLAPGILDGLAAYPAGGNRALVLVNHELNPGNGYAYSLATGTQLTGARVSAFMIERIDGCARIVDAGLAYDRIYARDGRLVIDPAQVNETGNAVDGFARFCSSRGVLGGTYGFADDLYFTGEETSKPFHPHGGTEWVIDVAGKAIHAAPALGRGAWENVTPIDTRDPGTIGLLLGDDVQSAPLYLYIGQKNAGSGGFLDRNGLEQGQLYVWVADNGDLDPQSFNGAGSVRAGSFQPIAVRDVQMAGQNGYDQDGYKDGATLRTEADQMGAFSFSRPEDLHDNPADGTQVVFASTGRGALFPADNWGTVYLIDLDFSVPGSFRADLEIIHDADGLPVPDAGIRSPDNLTWADNGMIYVQEDRSTSPSSLFGAATGTEASIWELDPTSGAHTRIATINRNVVRPLDATDIGAGSIGHWETSGVLDVTNLFDTKNGETLLLATVQAHGIRDGSIGDNALLDEGGQMVFLSKQASMLRGDTAATSAGFEVEPFFTVSETIGSYQPAGILDGTGAFEVGPGVAKILVNHELNPGNGYAYALANGTPLTGARVSSFTVRKTACGVEILDAGLAYDTIYDREGNAVTSAAQVNETGNGIDGFARFCSAQHVRAGTFGFVDDLFFTGEETSKPFHPHGGTEWVIDVQGEAIWALPNLGRGAWENVSPVETGDPNTVALLMGDDVQSAPLYLWVGQKGGAGTNGFLDRNGLEQGQLYVWVADNGDLTPQDWNGAGNVRTGTFQPIAPRDVNMAGQPGFDAMGYKDGDTLRTEADAMGAFSFSRPEDLHANPSNGAEFVFASTGRGALFPADNWGTLYIGTVSFSGPTITCNMEIVHDADGLATPDAGIRSPDNLTWASDGFIYVQEDRSTSPSSLFGGTTGVEASVWQLSPTSGAIRRVAEVDRSVVLPVGSTDIGAGSIGHWETSGVLDVSDIFGGAAGDTVLLATVQAHGIRDGLIGDNPLLDEGGQLVLIRKAGLNLRVVSCETVGGNAEITVDIENGTPGNSYFTAFAAENTGVAPQGGFYGIDITIPELLSELTPPFLGTLNGDGRATWSAQVPGMPCPLGITLDVVALDFGSNGLAQVSRAATIEL